MSRDTSGAIGGFTLVEAIVALTLSTVLVLLVSTVFLAQNEFYEDVVRRSDVQDEARSVVELVASEVRPATGSGFLVADSLRLGVREPLSVGVVCEVRGTLVSVYLPRPSAGLDTAEVTGYGIREPEGSWRFYDRTWSAMHVGSGGRAVDDCEAVGFDTSGLPPSHFVQLRGPGNTPSPPPRIGGSLMVQRDLELRFAESELDPGRVALYRGTYGETLSEFATGLGPDSRFRYRLKGNDDFVPAATGSDLERVEAVSVTAHAVSADEAARLGRYEYRLTRKVPVRNDR